MGIFAIDPGNINSAYIFYDIETKMPGSYGIVENGKLLNILNQCSRSSTFLAIEMIASYGMPVGKSVFDTCVWIGRFIQWWNNDETYRLIYRQNEKMLLCNSMRAKDGNIRQAIIDRYEPTGGGKIPQIGTKKQPGPLYGISKDVWSALAVAITAAETV